MRTLILCLATVTVGVATPLFARATPPPLPLPGWWLEYLVEDLLKGPDHPSEAQCLLGNYEFNQAAIEGTRSIADAKLREYVRLASGATAADVSSVFSSANAKPVWSRDGKFGDLLAIDDPLAREIAARPDALKMWGAPVIAGDRQTAVAVWRVGSSTTEYPAGWYRGRFNRGGSLASGWRLVALEAQLGGAVPEIAPYCHILGDTVTLNVRMPGMAKYMKDNKYMTHRWTADELREIRGPMPQDWPASLGGVQIEALQRAGSE